jgi:hypothetical protein
MSVNVAEDELPGLYRRCLDVLTDRESQLPEPVRLFPLMTAPELGVRAGESRAWEIRLLLAEILARVEVDGQTSILLGRVQVRIANAEDADLQFCGDQEIRCDQAASCRRVGRKDPPGDRGGRRR